MINWKSKTIPLANRPWPEFTTEKEKFQSEWICNFQLFRNNRKEKLNFNAHTWARKFFALVRLSRCNSSGSNRIDSTDKIVKFVEAPANVLSIFYDFHKRNFPWFIELGRELILAGIFGRVFATRIVFFVGLTNCLSICADGKGRVKLKHKEIMSNIFHKCQQSELPEALQEVLGSDSDNF